MGQKLFRRHVEDVRKAPPKNIVDICRTDDNVISFNFIYTRNGRLRSVNVQACVQPVEEYPDGHVYFLYTNDTDPEPEVAQSLDLLKDEVAGVTLPDVVSRISEALHHATTLGQAKNPIMLEDAENVDDNPEFDFDDDFDDGDDDDFGLNDFRKHATTNHVSSHVPVQRTMLDMDLPRVRSDLRAVKSAGFRVGVLGNLSHGGVVCTSVRVGRLGISDEAMQAWKLKREDYVVLMIRFQQGYQTLQDVQNESTLSGRTEMRVGLCNRYKPTLAQALSVFNQVTAHGPSDDTSIGSNESERSLRALFIGRPLNDLLRDRFPRILAIRHAHGLAWLGAENLYNEIQGRNLEGFGDLDDGYYDDDAFDRALPDLVTADQMNGVTAQDDLSLPLVAMQFVLRHLVRCTEFCLVCHCKTQDDFEAIKPYVCTKPLCLYQYMGLGFGPSIEWEILTQPRVVDLLISFCYVSAATGSLREFPLGIGLRIPVLETFTKSRNMIPRAHHYDGTNQTSNIALAMPTPVAARLNKHTGELVFAADGTKGIAPIKAGDWLVLSDADPTIAPEYKHYHVEESLLPTIRLKMCKSEGEDSADYAEDGETLKQWSNVLVQKYDQEFDKLSDNQKWWCITTLLDTLPRVTEMRTYLEVSQKGQDPCLRKWRSHISEAALNLLRWIIASNRSCIMQVDDLEDDVTTGHSYGNPKDHVTGMAGYMQFRFAQGAPDKEQRFKDEIDKHTGKLHHYRTMFAWHGSPLWNWHSIIREGLHYKDVAHGRSYGNGVYMADNAVISMGYSNGHSSHMHSQGLYWSKSELKLTEALSLNEVVNKPDKFVCQKPYYVVADINWIQTRYLFVRTEAQRRTIADDQHATAYAQDSRVIVYDEKRAPLQIPITALPKSRRPVDTSSAVKKGDKKCKITSTTSQAELEDAMSELSDAEDWLILADATDIEDDSCNAMDVDSDESITPFEPGTLDLSQMKLLKEPSYANPTATRQLMKSFRETLKTQQKSKLSELGWYINPDITNIYQWVVELHSFDRSLKLGEDMQKAGITSIVLEMRFTDKYPFSPPFVRVIQPRFLPFVMGGGGNVTDGGAMCLQVLTSNGWSPVSTIESILLQVRMAICDTERPARLDTRQRSPCYGVGEAVEAYLRACRAHGWTVPDGFEKIQKEA